MIRKRLMRCGMVGLLLCFSGCGFFRERLCCNRPSLMSRLTGSSASYPVEMGHSDCACEGTLTSGGPMLGTPIQGPGGVGAPILPIPQIKENPGRQKEYDPAIGTRGIKANETKSTKDGF